MEFDYRFIRPWAVLWAQIKAFMLGIVKPRRLEMFVADEKLLGVIVWRRCYTYIAFENGPLLYALNQEWADYHKQSRDLFKGGSNNVR